MVLPATAAPPSARTAGTVVNAEPRERARPGALHRAWADHPQPTRDFAPVKNTYLGYALVVSYVANFGPGQWRQGRRWTMKEVDKLNESRHEHLAAGKRDSQSRQLLETKGSSKRFLSR
jgi:hypothetical protein